MTQEHETRGHLVILPLQDKGDYILCEYEIMKSAMTAAAKEAVTSDDPHLSLKQHLCAWYCFDPRIKPDRIIEFKIIESSQPYRFLIQLHLTKNA